MSAPLSPAARTRTSSSLPCGSGSGCSWTVIEPSRIVAARMPRCCHRLTGHAPRWRIRPDRHTKWWLTSRQAGRNRFPMRPSLPQIAVPPLWRESRIGLEYATLRQSEVLTGRGVPAGEGRGVLLIPGFLAGDGSLGTMTHWLRAAGWHTRRAGIRANVDCSEVACARLEERLERLADTTGERVVIVGQSRGGVFAKALAA